eukprot:TRINITY_DN7131_c0_g1_i1.p1 TRINITY_DN7131_c0_g1~~TRINITY_DN7131_c0_g1_i1.p1  ORF type:complete len:104 (-),score=15.95 TRINITY_DN7131_c0_g1_i1:31-342(-)
MIETKTETDSQIQPDRVCSGVRLTTCESVLSSPQNSRKLVSHSKPTRPSSPPSIQICSSCKKIDCKIIDVVSPSGPLSIQHCLFQNFIADLSTSDPNLDCSTK